MTDKELKNRFHIGDRKAYGNDQRQNMKFSLFAVKYEEDYTGTEKARRYIKAK